MSRWQEACGAVAVVLEGSEMKAEEVEVRGELWETVSEVKSAELSDWQQMAELEDKLDGDSNNQKELQGVEQACGGRQWIEFLDSALEVPL